MNDPKTHDKVYRFILMTLVQTGQAPHYTEIAAEMGVSMEEGRILLHDLFSRGMAAWLFPETDLIASLAPFNNQPTHYRISVEGQQKWFGQ